MSDTDVNPTSPAANPTTPKKAELLVENAELRDQLTAERKAREEEAARLLDFEARLEEAQRSHRELAAKFNERLADDQDAAAARAERHAAEAEREASTAAPRILGTIPIYDTDRPSDVIRRADEVRAGKIPVDQATRFRVDSNIYVRGEALKARFRGASSIPLGSFVERGDFSDEDRAEYVSAGALVPVG